MFQVFQQNCRRGIVNDIFNFTYVRPILQMSVIIELFNFMESMDELMSHFNKCVTT